MSAPTVLAADRARFRRAPVGEPAPPQLTGEQRALLGMVADGHTAAAIARRFGLTESAISKRLRVIYRQLPARNAAHAVAIAYRAGLLPAPNRTADRPR